MAPHYHPAPFDDISSQVDDPIEFTTDLLSALNEARPYFSGRGNPTGKAMDGLMGRLEDILTRWKEGFDDDD